MNMFYKFFTLLLLALCANTVSAQILEGSLAELAAAHKATLVLDYSEAQIHGMSETEFSQYEPEWKKDLPIVYAKFQGAFDEKLNGYLLCNRTIQSDFTIHVKFWRINRKGDTICDMYILKNAGTEAQEEVAYIRDIRANGGVFGTGMNLIKDGAEHVGEKAGSFLKKELRKAMR